MNKPKPVAIIFGVGPLAGVGGATARRLAEGGYRVIASGRNAERLGEFGEQASREGLDISTITADATDPDAVFSVFDSMGDVAPSFVLHNVGGNWPMATLDMTPDFIENMWRTTCLSGMLVGNEALRRMRSAEAGTLLFTGASASMRGKPMFAGFAMAKAGLRAYVQACAREFGPHGIHVAHVIIDGVVNGERLQRLAPNFLKEKPADGSVEPSAVAETFWQMHQQPRNAWTHELEVRPYCEVW